ncbi:hypothetical protein CsSME_00052473 [Camellia sinensis var. sinensis]
MRGYLNKDISIALFELGNYFQQLCSKTDETTEIVQISIADSISNTLRRTDIAPDIIPSQTTQMPPGQATKRRSTTSMSEANLVELPTHMSTAPSPVDASASLSLVDASPSSQTVDIVRGPTRGKNSSRLIS